MARLHYGDNTLIELDPPDGVMVEQYGMPRGEPLRDVAVAATEAVEAPLGYPPLRQCFTPSDNMAIALDHAVPHAPEAVAAVVGAAIAAKVDPAYITILRSEADVQSGIEDPRSALSSDLRDRIRLLTHDPTDQNALAYLAATDAGHRVMLNRTLHDADIVVPIGCIYPHDAAGYYGVHTGVFPTFSDLPTLERFRAFGSLGGAGDYRRGLIDEVTEVGWLLGIQFTVQVIPADGFGAQHIVAGHPDAVQQRGDELYAQVWNGTRQGPRTSLVIAAVSGRGRQTWQGFGRALDNARRLVAENGAIAVCCELSAEPGPALQRMVGARSRQEALQEIRAARPVDALPAAQLARALDDVTVYLLSRLDPEMVEELEMVPIEKTDELRRLAQRHGTCSVLNNATCAVVPID